MYVWVGVAVNVAVGVVCVYMCVSLSFFDVCPCCTSEYLCELSVYSLPLQTKIQSRDSGCRKEDDTRSACDSRGAQKRSWSEHVPDSVTRQKSTPSLPRRKEEVSTHDNNIVKYVQQVLP